ncbi:uncharacterized protein LOC6536587 [Drosophila yakuba]|uniref:Uncharacterized protein n=1 Tax=Drosophila yakuba TaxID=7245 RepID=B4PLG8_DROYA|nr:uncharacterized protein LOC6536587 [Drosophila yakuba]EDW96875.1 uncharacterized protein Dyak_GE24649 [Drosophila yakuba]
MLKYIVIVLLTVIPKSLLQVTMSYEAIFVSVTSSENAQPIDISNLRLIGRQRILNGTFEILEDVDDTNYQLSVDIYSNAARDGNYKLIPLRVSRQGICTIFKKYGFYLKDCIKNGINTDLHINTTSCLFPKGRYYLKNVTLNVQNWPKIMQRGLCRHVGTFYKYDVPVGTLNVTSSIEDRAPNVFGM